MQLVIIAIAWLIMGFVITVYDFIVTHTSLSLVPSVDYSFALALFRNMGAGFIGALLGGSVLEYH